MAVEVMTPTLLRRRSVKIRAMAQQRVPPPSPIPLIESSRKVTDDRIEEMRAAAATGDPTTIAVASARLSAAAARESSAMLLGATDILGTHVRDLDATIANAARTANAGAESLATWTRSLVWATWALALA